MVKKIKNLPKKKKKNGQCFISPYGNTGQSNINVVRKKRKRSTSDKILDCLTNSPYHYHNNSMENSKEIIYADIRV